MTRPVDLVLLASLCLPAFAGDADVLDVNVSCNSSAVCRFDVTVRLCEQMGSVISGRRNSGYSCTCTPA
jgi:hypothetical protein